MCSLCLEIFLLYYRCLQCAYFESVSNRMKLSINFGRKNQFRCFTFNLWNWNWFFSLRVRFCECSEWAVASVFGRIWPLNLRMYFIFNSTNRCVSDCRIRQSETNRMRWSCERSCTQIPHSVIGQSRSTLFPLCISSRKTIKVNRNESICGHLLTSLIDHFVDIIRLVETFQFLCQLRVD